MLKKILFFSLTVICVSFGSPIYAEEVAPDPVDETIIEEPLAESEDQIEDDTATSTPEVMDEEENGDEVGQQEVATTTPEIAVSVRLQIETLNETILDETIEVTPCLPTPESTEETLTAYCALEQSELEISWNFFGDDAFLDSIEGVANDFDTGTFWNWFGDLEYGMTALNKHQLSEEETLLLTYDTFPLKLEIPNEVPIIGATTTVTVLEFGFDESWNPVWTPSSGSTVTINDIPYATVAGSYDLVPTSTEPLNIIGTKEGFISTILFIISPQKATSTEPSGGGGGGGTQEQDGNETSTSILDVDRALAFLAARQAVDGSFDADLYTDWIAIAFAASSGHNSTKEQLRAFYQSDNLSPASVTDYERRAMTLMALGIDPYAGTSINYIEKIEKSFDGTQIGSRSLVNDDIFALFPLMSAGYEKNDELIQQTVAFILQKQEESGRWESPDLTAAALQALSLASFSGTSKAREQGRTYLESIQKNDGGFGNTFGTSWILQAIAALGEDPNEWTKETNTPHTYLASQQQVDGGLESISTDLNTRLWATAYAVPAALELPWESLLSSFDKLDAEEEESPLEPLEIPVATSTPPLTPTTPLASEGIEPSGQQPIPANPRIDSSLASLDIRSTDTETENSTPIEKEIPQNLLASAVSVEEKAGYQKFLLIIGIVALAFFLNWISSTLTARQSRK